MIHQLLKFFFKVTVLLLLLSSVTSKSISDRNGNTDVHNEVEHEEKIKAENVRKVEPTLKIPDEEYGKEKPVEGFEKDSEKHKEEIEGKSGDISAANKDKGQEEPANGTGVHKDIDPTTSTDTSETPRSSRTIGRLREVDSPTTLIENFRNKLKTARNNLEGSLLARKAAEPRIFIFDPNADKIKSLPKPTVSTYGRTIPQEAELEEEPQKEQPQSNIKKLITSPIIDDSSSSSSEEHTKKTSSKIRQNPEGPPSESQATEDITHLLVVRNEINKIRHMMQTLREQQLRQKLGAQFPLSRNLTEEETKNLEGLIDDLKDQGKISTSQLNPQPEDTDFQNHPPETTKLIEDIKKLKESVFSFAKQVGGPQSAVGSIEELEKQIHQQRDEIENLKRLVDELQPPRHFPTNPVLLKHQKNVKSDLNLELRSLQDILNELLKKEEEKEKIQLRSALLRATEDSAVNKPKTDEEISTLMKIFRSMQQPNSEIRQSSVLESKLEKLERELKEMDTQHQRTRQELKLQKLEHDIKSIKSPPVQSEDLKEQIRRLEENLGKNQQLSTSTKISALQNQLKQLDKPLSRSLDLPGDIEKELDNLQHEIDLMTLKNLQNTKNGLPLSSRQLESLFADILSPSVDEPAHDSTPSASIGKLIKTAKKIPSKIHDIPSKIEHPPPPIYQLPYCLQKYPDSHSYPVHNPQYHPYPPSKPNEPVPANKIEYQSIKTPHPTKVVKETNEYQQPAKEYTPQQQVKVIEHPQPVKEYNNEKYGVNQQQVTTEKEYNNEEYQPIKNQQYNKEVTETKPVLHHVYQPKAIPVKIEYHPQQEQEEHQEYAYPEEEIQYQHYKPCPHHENIEEEIDYSQNVEPNYDMYRTQNYKRNKREADYDYDKKILYNDIKQRLATLREAVENVRENENYPSSSENDLTSDFERSAISDDYYPQYNTKYSYPVKKSQKFDNLFIKMVKFILHKLEISAPFIVESLFDGEAFDHDNDGFGYKYRSASEDTGNYSEEKEAENIFGKFLNNFQGFNGLLGFIPTVLFKLLSNFSSFLSILKRNTFFKNFLFPGALILVVDGIMAVFAWWFSTDENHNVITYQNNSVNEQY